MAKKAEVATVSPRSELAKRRVAQAATEMVRPEQSAEEMALAILESTDIDDILGSTVVHLADMLDTPFTILAAYLNQSDFTDGLGAFTVMEVEFQDGKRGVVTTGATNIVAQVIAMHGGGHFPQWVLAESDTTKAGFTVYRLRRAPGERPTQAQLENF